MTSNANYLFSAALPGEPQSSVVPNMACHSSFIAKLGDWINPLCDLSNGNIQNNPSDAIHVEDQTGTSQLVRFVMEQYQPDDSPLCLHSEIYVHIFGCLDEDTGSTIMHTDY
ncbi:hypothetical protein E2C01_010490 [Portunus trituberculatus]|uniref:Uncharacterized protein n=1 Tax=Portunus trituberculatus TaxID=210409 RepID=A0A5B7D8S7_PORTR|nr:hypothetical protein [Portunus trituberculatus]